MESWPFRDAGKEADWRVHRRPPCPGPTGSHSPSSGAGPPPRRSRVVTTKPFRAARPSLGIVQLFSVLSRLQPLSVKLTQRSESHHRSSRAAPVVGSGGWRPTCSDPAPRPPEPVSGSGTPGAVWNTAGRRPVSESRQRHRALHRRPVTAVACRWEGGRAGSAREQPQWGAHRPRGAAPTATAPRGRWAAGPGAGALTPRSGGADAASLCYCSRLMWLCGDVVFVTEKASIGSARSDGCPRGRGPKEPALTSTQTAARERCHRPLKHDSVLVTGPGP